MEQLSLAERSAEKLLDKPQLRHKPQLREVGPGKRYANRAAWKADVERHEAEKAQHKLDYQEWRKQQDRLRDHSGRQQDRSGRQQPSGASNRKTAAEKAQSMAQKQVEPARPNRGHNSVRTDLLRALRVRSGMPMMIGQQVCWCVPPLHASTPRALHVLPMSYALDRYVPDSDDAAAAPAMEEAFLSENAEVIKFVGKKSYMGFTHHGI